VLRPSLRLVPDFLRVQALGRRLLPVPELLQVRELEQRQPLPMDLD
jgi:hypothetical protein